MFMFGLILMTLLAGVEPFKMSFKSPPTTLNETQQSQAYYQQPIFLAPPAAIAPQQQFYQAPISQQKVESLEQVQTDVKGGASAIREPIRAHEPLFAQQPFYQQPSQLQFLQPQALAYLIVRPIAQQYHHYEPARFYQQPTQALIDHGVKGGDIRNIELQPVQQEASTDSDQQTADQQPAQSGAIFAKGSGKFMKLKSSLEQFAASAKAKLTLGSSYQVVSEETIQQTTQAPQSAPIEQTRIEQTKIEQTREEQQPVREEQVPLAQETLSQERLPEAEVVQQPLMHQQGQLAEQQHEQTIAEARREAKGKLVGTAEPQHPLGREQTRLTGQNHFEPLRSGSLVSEADSSRQQQQQLLKGRH